MPNWNYVTHEDFARGKSVYVFLDSSKEGPNNFAVRLTYNRVIYAGVGGISRAEAMEHLQEQGELPGLGGDGSWNAVLDRIYKRERDVPYEGSALQVANTHFEVGSWNWLVTLASHRELQAKTGE